MNRVPMSHLRYPGDGLYYQGATPFTGVGVYPQDGSGVLAEEEYRDGLLCGVRREWHPSGRLASEAECRHGVSHGRTREWSDGGLLLGDSAYEYGYLVESRRWDEGGDLVEEFTLAVGDPGYDLLVAMRESLGGGGGTSSAGEPRA